MKKERKIYVSVNIESSILKKMDLIVEDPNNIFDDRSTLIRYFIKNGLPELEKGLKEEIEARKWNSLWN